ncbi:MAG: type II toxin-antitoxin system VapC family toxin [Candidatus Methylumidiphilus sp.]
MRLLLDTHIALWAITDSPKLTQPARSLLLTASCEIFVSVATVWEIAIKHSVNRGNMPCSGYEARRFFMQAGYKLLAITDAHVVAVETLPPIHADPFDRILIAQAMTEHLHLITHDEAVVRYDGNIVRV